MLLLLLNKLSFIRTLTIEIISHKIKSQQLDSYTVLTHESSVVAWGVSKRQDRELVYDLACYRRRMYCVLPTAHYLAATVIKYACAFC